MPTTVDYDAEVARLVERYYDIADTFVAATATGCRVLQANPFALPTQMEAELRSKLLAG